MEKPTLRALVIEENERIEQNYTEEARRIIREIAQMQEQLKAIESGIIIRQQTLKAMQIPQLNIASILGK